MSGSGCGSVAAWSLACLRLQVPAYNMMWAMQILVWRHCAGSRQLA